MRVSHIARFERFFRLAASLDVDKADLKRYRDFLNRKTGDLLVRGVGTAKLEEVLDELVARPALDLPCDGDTEALLPALARRAALVAGDPDPSRKEGAR